MTLRHAVLVALLCASGAGRAHANDRNHFQTTGGRMISVPGPGEAHGSTAIGPPTSRAMPDGPRPAGYREIMGRPSTHAELAAELRSRAPQPPSAATVRHAQELLGARALRPGNHVRRARGGEADRIIEQLDRVRMFDGNGRPLGASQKLMILHGQGR